MELNVYRDIFMLFHIFNLIIRLSLSRYSRYGSFT